MTRVTMTDIAELARVKRPAVSNWRRRHDSFPAPVGGSATKPEFDADRIAEWLDDRPLLEPIGDGPRTYGEVFRSNLRIRGLAGARGDDGSVFAAIALTARRAQLGRPLTADDAPDASTRRIVNDLVDTVGPAAAVERVIATANRGTSALWAQATPPPVVELIAALVGDVSSRSVCDPAVGIGDLLVRVLDGHQPAALSAFDLSETALTALRDRLMCHGIDADLRRGDSLSDWPAGPADVIVLDPPFVSGEFSSRAEHEREAGPLDWARQATRNLAPGGRAYAVLPSWTLTRQPDARRWLLDEGVLSAVIQLPRRVQTFRTGTELVLVVLARPGEAGGEAVLCDADMVARRGGDRWPQAVARMVERPEDGPADMCRTVPIAELRDAASWLPAHRLAPVREPVDHVKQAIDARRALYQAFRGNLWARDLDLAEARPDAGQRRLADVAEIIGGHRVRAEHIEALKPDTGRMRVIGAEELRGERPVGSRSIDNPLALGAYSAVEATRKGDVIVLAERGVRAMVDTEGDSIVLFSAQIVRPYPEGVPARVLARMLEAPRNAGRESGSLVRRVSLRAMVVPDLPAAELVRLEAYLADLDTHRAELRDRLAALDELDRVVSAGAADGVLRVVPAPEHPRAMMGGQASEASIEEK